MFFDKIYQTKDNFYMGQRLIIFTEATQGL